MIILVLKSGILFTIHVWLCRTVGWVRSTMAKVFEIRLLHLWECRRTPGEFTKWIGVDFESYPRSKKIKQKKYYIYNKFHDTWIIWQWHALQITEGLHVKFPAGTNQAWRRRTRSCSPSVFEGCNGRELRWTRCKVRLVTPNGKGNETLSLAEVGKNGQIWWQQMSPIFWVIAPTKKGDRTEHNMFNWCQLIDFCCCSKDYEPPFISFHHSCCWSRRLSEIVEISSSTWRHSIRQSWIVYRYAEFLSVDKNATSATNIRT